MAAKHQRSNLFFLQTTNKCKSEVDRAQADLDMLNKTRNRLHKQWQQATTAAEKLQQDLHDKTQFVSTFISCQSLFSFIFYMR